MLTSLTLLVVQGRSKKVTGEANPLACIKWWRIVFDESHAVKGDASKALKAVQALHVRLRPSCRPELSSGLNRICDHLHNFQCKCMEFSASFPEAPGC